MRANDTDTTDRDAAEPTLDDLADALLLEAEALADRSADLPDALTQYLHAIGRTPLLTQAQEVALMQAIVAGAEARATLEAGGRIAPPVRRRLRHADAAGEAARTEMISANLRLVVSIAKKYRDHGVPLLDLIQEGNIGLMRALAKFDADKGFKFSTYATWWIRQAVTRYLAEMSRVIRLPVHRGDDRRAYYGALNALRMALGREPGDAELIAFLNEPAERKGAAGNKPPKDGPTARWTPQKLDSVREAIRIACVDSLDRQIGAVDAPDSRLGAFIPAPTDTAHTAEAALMSAALRAAVATLPERERHLIALRYGLEDGQERTLAEVGEVFGVSRERVRQIEAVALRRLRHPARARLIRPRPDVA
ncbi:sigma-70 family RNA polymerase sigma factor [Chloroflexales bacterium ZM16-3]|nr:sigma-70 family RNA polymerase sigma factor [Chloroflexales bacterium ZM16-3]